ncbi:MAG: hypothetical protein PUC30_07210 [Lachnospiraceae bacterium]|nr:hypothetical protein [Lachnospiraceae bacterium]
MKKNVFEIAIVCLAIMAVGCGSETEGPQPTVAVLPTEAVVSEAPMPTEAAVPVPEGLPIDEEHFGDASFCELLQKEFDADGNGFFSDTELAEVKELKLAAKKPVATIKGFSHFPNLEYITLPPAEQVEIVGVPSLKRVSNGVNRYVEQNYIKAIKVADCPALERLDFSTIAIGSEADNEENFVIENCPRLQQLNLSNSVLKEMIGRISGTSPLIISFDRGTGLPKKLRLDHNVSIRIPFTGYDEEGHAIVMSEQLPFEWMDGESDVQAAAWQELRETVDEFKQGFSVSVEETAPAVYDGNGVKAYYLMVENSLIQPTLYESLDIYGHYYDKGKDYILIYETKCPEACGFEIKWTDKEEYQLFDYSPVNGLRGRYYNEFEICRTTQAGEEMLGAFAMSVCYAFNEAGDIKLSSFLTRDQLFEEISTDGVLLSQSENSIAPEEGDLPIDKEHFSSVFMRKYLKQYIDSDENGYLSTAELEAVTGIDLFGVNMGVDVVDGFEWFPKLRNLSMPYCTAMVIRDCPQLVNVYASEGQGTGSLTIENCPKLENLDLTYAGASNLYVKDCENFRYITFYNGWDVGIEETVWEFVNTPKLTVAPGGQNEFGAKLIADAKEVSICFADMWPELSYGEEGQLLLEGRERFVWNNLTEDCLLPSENILTEEFVMQVLKQHFEGMEIQIDYSKLLMYSPGKGADYLIDVVPDNAEPENAGAVSRKRCCILITPDKEVVFFDSYEQWKEERVPGWRSEF